MEVPAGNLFNDTSILVRPSSSLRNCLPPTSSVSLGCLKKYWSTFSNGPKSINEKLLPIFFIGILFILSDFCFASDYTYTKVTYLMQVTLEYQMRIVKTNRSVCPIANLLDI